MSKTFTKTSLNLFIFIILSFFLLFSLVIMKVNAAGTDTVDATVTAEVFSVSVTDGNVTFGTIAQSSTEDTTATGVNESQTATNDGTITAKFNIKGADSTGGTGWTLAAAAGTEEYTMEYCVSDCDGTPTWVDVGIDPSYVTLAASVNAASNQVFDLQVGTPTSTSETTEQAITITVQATTP